MESNQLPFGSGFSPSQINLIKVLEIAKSNIGCKNVEAALRIQYVDQKQGLSEDNARKLAMNARLGMRKYGVINQDCSLTELGKKLLALKANSVALYEEFGKHI